MLASAGGILVFSIGVAGVIGACSLAAMALGALRAAAQRCHRCMHVGLSCRRLNNVEEAIMHSVLSHRGLVLNSRLAPFFVGRTIQKEPEPAVGTRPRT